MSRTNAVASSSRRRASPPPEEEDDVLRKPAINGGETKPLTQENREDEEGRDGDEDDDNDDDDPRMQWTVQTFQDVPVGQESLAQLRDLKTTFIRMGKTFDKGIEMGTSTAAWYETVEEDHPRIAEIQAGVLDLIDKFRITKKRLDIVDEIIGQIRDGEIAEMQEFYKRRVSAEMEAYGKLTSRMKYKDDEKFVAFRQAIWDVNHEDEPCPPMSNWLPREEGDVDDDDDFEIGGATQKFICPLTMRPYEDATKSSGCGHYYSFAAVNDYIRQADPRRGATKCPFSGCNAKLTAAMLVKDPQMQARTDRFVQRQRLREEEDDEDDDNFINVE